MPNPESQETDDVPVDLGNPKRLVRVFREECQAPVHLLGDAPVPK